MPSALDAPATAAVLERLHAAAREQDEPARQRVRAREAEAGRLGQAQRYELYGGAPLAVKPDVGRLLYVTALALRPRTIVEFGASLGVSTIYLAAALADGGGERLVTSELLPAKAEATRANLEQAGLGHLVEVRTGDALETLRTLDTDVQLVFLDGRNDLYLDVLRLIEPRLSPRALVAADLNVGDTDLQPFLDHVRDPAGGYLSVEVPVDEGVELSVRCAG